MEDRLILPRKSHTWTAILMARSERIFSQVALPIVVATITMTGCGSGLDQIGSGTGSTTNPNVKAAIEPNDTFGSATDSFLVETLNIKSIRLQGSIPSESDLDVFLLGSLDAGDEITVDATAQNSGLDISVALFDSDERLLYANDDRAFAGAGFLDSYIHWIVRHASDSVYLVVTRSAFAPRGMLTGSYQVDVSVSSGKSVPPPKEQILLLDFDGGMLNSPTLDITTVQPFDAGAISSLYQGQTQIVKDSIRGVFEQNFGRFDVRIITTDDLVPFDPNEVSTVFFGGFSASTFGIAENVDLYNFDICDDAVIFTETFGAGVFSTMPSAQDLGIAIGNVGSHEAGHLLGLNHVDDDRALMDDQSNADAFLLDQEFMVAPLSSDLMPIGFHDSPLLLAEIVGLIDPTALQGITAKPTWESASRAALFAPVSKGQWVKRVPRKSIRYRDNR